MKRRPIAHRVGPALVATVVFVLGCSREKQPDGPASMRAELAAPMDLAGMTDDEKLLLFKQLPLGSPASRVRELLPALGEARFEGTSLTDATVAYEFLGHSTRLELNFKDDILYSVNTGVSDMSAADGQAMFERLTDFYSKRFGPPVSEDGSDSPYFVSSRSWQLPVAEVGFIMSFIDSTRRIGWGYQRPRVPSSRH